jgi:hypothetical protein
VETDAPPREATPPSTDKRPIHWLLEGIFIVVSVLLGFGINEFGEYRKERGLAAQMLASIQSEVDYNRAALSTFIPMHRVWRDALQKQGTPVPGESGIDVLFETRPQLSPEMRTNIPVLRRAAWDAALSTGALRLIDYNLAAGLSEMYGMQDYAASAFSKLFSEPSFFDPSLQASTIRLAQTTMQEMTWAEETLLALYDKHLPAIRAGAAGE